VNQGNELLDCCNVRRWLITVPFEIPTLPENSPPTARSDVCGFCEGLFLLLTRSATPHWPDFKELHALARNAKAEIELRPDVGRRPAAFNEATHCLPNSRRFKFAERHREPTPNGEVERPRRSAGLATRAHNLFQRPRRPTAHASRPPPTIVRRPPEPLSRHSRPRCAWEPGLGIAPKRVRAPLALQIAAVTSADAAAGHCVSLNRHRLASNAPWQAAQCISATVSQDQGDCCGEALSRCCLRATLSVRAWHFLTIRDEPLAVALNNRREFVSHDAIIARDSAGTRGRLTAKLSGRTMPLNQRCGRTPSHCPQAPAAHNHPRITARSNDC